MIIRFKYGFKIDNTLYCFKLGTIELYRMPQMMGLKFYPLKKIPLIDVGKSKGYLVSRKRKSLKQLKDMTIFIDHKYQEIPHKDMPF